MQTKTLNDIRGVLPLVVIEIIWTHDEDARWDIADPSLDPDDFQAWNSEVRATAIVNGKFVHGAAFLSGTWERFGDNPAESNPEISGYLPQMLEEALHELAAQVPGLKAAIESALQ